MWFLYALVAGGLCAVCYAALMATMMNQVGIARNEFVSVMGTRGSVIVPQQFESSSMTAIMPLLLLGGFLAWGSGILAVIFAILGFIRYWHEQAALRAELPRA